MNIHTDTGNSNTETRDAASDLPLQADPQIAAWGPEALALRNRRNREHQASVAASRPGWIRRNAYYYSCLKRLLRHLVEPGKRVLNVRCQTGFLLDALEPSYGVGVEISREMVEVAQAENPQFTYYESFPE